MALKSYYGDAMRKQNVIYRLSGCCLAVILMALVLPGCQQSAVDAQQQRDQAIAFLAENAKKPGVKITPSGLQYEVLQEGQGQSPVATDSVTVNYRGSLISGAEFDSGEGISFGLNQVIPGWTEGLQLMKEGSKYRFYIPSDLAYGENGAGSVIPPDAALIFDVELLSVLKP